MFQDKNKDLRVMKLRLSFNITEIKKYLEKGGELDLLEKWSEEPTNIFEEISYEVDSLCIPGFSEIYFHPTTGRFHNTYSASVKNQALEQDLFWYGARDLLIVGTGSYYGGANTLLILPVLKFFELETKGKVTPTKVEPQSMMRNITTIQVPIEFNDNKVTKYSFVTEETGPDVFIEYRNPLVKVRAMIDLQSPVFY